MITSLDQLDFSKQYTYSDYILWKFQERVELLKGWIFPMAAPSAIHQEISTNLNGFLWTFLRKNSCKLYAAPFDVRLPLPQNKAIGNKIDTVVQPDLCVICDENKIKKQGCIGAPDLMVEILSPGNSKKEMKGKFELYEEAGVLEYWIVDPVHRSVLVYYLKNGKFVGITPPYTDEDILTSTVFQELKIDLSEVFPEEKIP
ncbi:MAG: Uma2 family endonuclease [Chitinophagales bacterium]